MLKNNNVRGGDSITAELTKWSQQNIISKLQLLFEDTWELKRCQKPGK